MNKGQQYQAFYRDFRRNKASIYEACPTLIQDLGLAPIWNNAYQSYVDNKSLRDPLTLTLKERLYRRSHVLAYAA